jgi:hypothetical protein
MLPITSEVAPPNRRFAIRLWGIVALAAAVVGLAVIATGEAAPPTEPSDNEPTIGGQPLFASWPGSS